jgi:tryptophan 2,3-dioxygenase
VTERLELASAPTTDADRRTNGYRRALRLDELLELQSLSLGHHDELLFVVVHQAYELWFKLLLGELEETRDRLHADDVHTARHLLARVQAIVRLMNEQVALIDTMSFCDFLSFRERLGSASAFESVQFREIECVSGLKDARYARVAGDPERLRRRLDEPTLWDAYCTVLERRGLPMPADDRARRLDSLLAVLGDSLTHPELFALSEDLVAYDQAFRLWRCRHLLTVERQIGTRPGTGGTSGSRYLRATLDKYYFPDLWYARTAL